MKIAEIPEFPFNSRTPEQKIVSKCMSALQRQDTHSVLDANQMQILRDGNVEQRMRVLEYIWRAQVNEIRAKVFKELGDLKLHHDLTNAQYTLLKRDILRRRPTQRQLKMLCVAIGDAKRILDGRAALKPLAKVS